jgi:hypothetical protein
MNRWTLGQPIQAESSTTGEPMFDYEPRRRDRAFIVSSHESTDLKRFVSMWTDGIKVGLMAFEKTDKYLKPVNEWQSSHQAMNFDFAAILKEWHAATPIEKAIVNGLNGIDSQKHPVKQLLAPYLKVDVVEPVLPFEGLAAYQEALTTERLDLAGYPGGARLTERIQRLSGSPEPLLMAFLQGIAKEPRFYTYSGQSVYVGTPNRYGDIFD